MEHKGTNCAYRTLSGGTVLYGNHHANKSYYAKSLGSRDYLLQIVTQLYQDRTGQTTIALLTHV